MAARHMIVIGGSYVGSNTAKQLAAKFHGQYRVLLIEKNSHFQHLFAFPRFAVTTNVDTHKAFIPYVPGTFAECPPGSGEVVQAKVIGISDGAVQLDQAVTLHGKSVDSIPYSHLVLAGKTDGVLYLQKHAQKVKRSAQIVVIGGGAVGVQMATDIKELYPEKSVTLVHSRSTLGSRVRVPPEGYPTDGTAFEVELENGTRIPADFAIICTGQTPQGGVIQTLSPESLDERGFIRTLSTLQINDPRYPNVYAVGDVAATGAHKAAKPGAKQAAVVVNNIEHSLKGEPLEHYNNTDPPGIHLTLGITKNVVFGNPVEGKSEPFTKHRDDGRLDMNIDGVWKRRGGPANAYL